jgi:hypothetical protein
VANQLVGHLHNLLIFPQDNRLSDQVETQAVNLLDNHCLILHQNWYRSFDCLFQQII